MSMWRLSMWTWPSHICVAIYVFKVRFFFSYSCNTIYTMCVYWKGGKNHLICTDLTAFRPHGRSSHIDDLLRGRNYRHQTHVQDSARLMGCDRENRYEPLGSVSSMATAGQTGQKTGFHLSGFRPARSYLHALEGVLSGPRPSRAHNIRS